MNVTLGMVDKELRSMAVLVKLFARYSTPEQMKRHAEKDIEKFRGKTGSGMILAEEEMTCSSGRAMRLCVYSPEEARDGLPLVLWLHGGGYAMGAPEQDVPFFETLMAAAPCIVVAPEYSLSWQSPYPTALREAHDALVWAKDNALRLGARTDQIFTGGNSAGGGLTAALSLYARDEGKVNIAFQMPLYPMLDCRVGIDSAARKGSFAWNEVNNEVGWRLYLGDRYGAGDIPSYASPALATDFSGLPPTYSYVGDIELFREETLAYVDKLKDAGIDAAVDVYEGCFHGFDVAAPKAAVTKKARLKLQQVFSSAVSERFAPQDAETR